jgi:hypothetical protein
MPFGENHSLCPNPHLTNPAAQTTLASFMESTA